MSGFKQLAAGMSQKRIDSPLAKYSSSGQLSCIICNQVVKSELLWNAHLNSKTHLNNKSQMKMQLVGQTAKPLSNLQTEPQTNKKPVTTGNVVTSKRPTETSADEGAISNKKQKLEGIVKSTNSIDLNKINSDFDAHYKNVQSAAPVQKEETSLDECQSATNSNLKNSDVVLAMTGTTLPEGFFDDPEMDAKARGQSRAQNLEAEFEEFKKIIQSEDIKSEIIIEQDDDRSNVDRNIEEVDEMINRWNKIEDLHNRREELKKLKTQEVAEQKMEEDDESDDEDVDLDNFLSFNLRSKNRF